MYNPTPLSAPPAAPAPPLRVLVVDDLADAADSLVLLLRLSGHEATAAYDGVSALAAAEALGPDAVFLDLGLPGLDGLAVARRLRERPGSDRVLLVALTGHGQAEDRRRSLLAGFDAFLLKPCDPRDVESLLAGWARSRCARTAPAGLVAVP